jgi:hypothetical protein
MLVGIGPDSAKLYRQGNTAGAEILRRVRIRPLGQR